MAALRDLRVFRAVAETLERRFLLSGEVPQSNPLLHTTPYAPVTVQQSQAAAQFSNLQALPGSFSLFPSYVTGVRDQGQCGSCWTFATYGSLESSILMAGGPATDLSENNLKDYHGFDWGPCDGGNSYMSEAYLSRGSGPVSEANDPYNAWDDRVTPAPSYPREYWVTQMLRYDTMDEMKNALMTNGALYTTMYWDDGSYRDSDYTYCYTGTVSDSNHAVTIVGWDDSKITAAPTPGAWLIKNSWGTSWGDGGYFWLSYADSVGAKSGESFSGAVPASTYSNVYYWDTFGDVEDMASPWAMNRFVAQSDEELKAVGFFTEADDASYTISVYDTFSGGSLSSLLGSSSGTSATAGWHTINLPSAIGLTTGNDFYVVVSITNGGADPQAYDCQIPGYTSACTSAPNESWYSNNGTTWTDLTKYDPTANFCVKAFACSNNNHAPTGIALSPSSIPENQSSGTAVGTLSTTDPDVGDTFTYSLVTGTGSTDNASFSISGSTLRTAAVFNYQVQNSYSIRVRTTDQGGLWYEQAFTITVTQVTHAPTDITLAGNSVPEKEPSGTTVGVLSTMDPIPGNTFTYSLVIGPGGMDNGSFSISGNQLRTAAVFDYAEKSSYSIRVRTTDKGGLWYEKVLTIMVEGVNQSPTDITLASTLAFENLPAGTVISGILGTDPDPGQSAVLTFSLVPGYGDNSLFAIVSNQLRAMVTFDYETRSSYSIRLRATDPGGLWCEKDFTITIIDVNENPTDIELANTSVAENLPAGTVVGAISGTDPDFGQSATLTFSLPSGYGDNSLFQVVGNQLMTKAVFDYETRSSYSIQLQATDTGGLSYNKAFTITIIDVNENPTAIALANMSVAENLPAGTVVGAVSGTDPDFGQSATLTFGLVPGYGDNALFQVVGKQLMTNAVFDYETRSSYSIQLRATDTGGLSYDKAFTITIIDVNENPTDIELTNTSVAENLPAGTVVGAVSGTDPDFGQSATLTFGLVPGYGHNSLFELVGNQLKTATRFDYEARNTYSIQLRATDTGGLSYEKTLTIHITDDPSDLRGQFGLINGKTIKSPAIQDADGDLVTLSLTGGGSGKVYGFGDSFEDIILTGTGAKSSLTISVTKNKSGGDGLVTIGNITSDGLLKGISASATVLSGQVQLNTLNQTPGKASVALAFQQISDANITVQGMPVTSIAVGGTVSDSRIITTASVSKFTATALLDSDILVGVATSFAGQFAGHSDFTNTSAKLGALTVAGKKLAKGSSYPAYVSGVHLSAPSIGTLKLANVDSTAGAVQANVLADTGTLTITALNPMTAGVMVLTAGSWKAGKAGRPGIIAAV